MTNNQFCAFIGGLGCLCAFLCMGLIFFGVTPAIWGFILGAGLAYIGMVNFD